MSLKRITFRHFYLLLDLLEEMLWCFYINKIEVQVML